MIKQITAEILAKKQAGVKTVRLMLSVMTSFNGIEIPQIVYVAEVTTDSVLIKSDEMAAWFRDGINDAAAKYDSFTVTALDDGYYAEVGAFERR